MLNRAHVTNIFYRLTAELSSFGQTLLIDLNRTCTRLKR